MLSRVVVSLASGCRSAPGNTRPSRNACTGGNGTDIVDDVCSFPSAPHLGRSRTMPQYRTEVTHDLGRAEAVARLKATAEWARGFSDLKGAWEGSTFTFSLSVQGIGMSGSVEVE